MAAGTMRWRNLFTDHVLNPVLQVAKMLKEIPRGATFVIRLVEPLKAGFGESSIPSSSHPLSMISWSTELAGMAASAPEMF